MRNLWKLCGVAMMMPVMFSACNLTGFGGNQAEKSTDLEQEAVQLEQHMDEVVQNIYGEEIAASPGVALMVSRHGQPLLIKAYGLADMESGTPLTTTTNLRMASVSKQFTAMATYLLIDRGMLTFDTPLGELFEGLASAPAAVTVGQLLHHTSGLIDYEGLIPKERQEQVSDTDVLEMIRGIDSLYFESGTDFRYSNTGFCLLSLVVEKVSGMDYREYMQQEIFRPLGMTNAYMYHAGTEMLNRAYGYRPLGEAPELDFRFADQSVTSATKGDGCVYISAESYLSWANAVLRGGFPSSEYLEDLEALKTPVRDGIFYSLGWFVAPPSTAHTGMRLFHSGETTGFRNITYHDLGSGLSVSVFANRDDTLISGVFEAILKQVGETHPAAELVEPEELFFFMSSIY